MTVTSQAVRVLNHRFSHWRAEQSNFTCTIWLLESYMGGFIGMYGTAGTYSVGNLFGSKYRYEGEGYGVGLSVGKAYQIGRRWNLEWEVGAGAVWLAYDKYLCKRCGDLVDSDYGWHFLPTRAALNLVYLF